ncbi:MAG: cysteine desulfurase [Anaerolineae bacterium]|nr:cysteine desulfurase [Anaerolineae bacterium]
MQSIYLDHSATTPLDPRVLAAMQPYFAEYFGNSKAIHRAGHLAEAAIEGARATVARCLGCLPADVVFTSGGTESDNLALRGPAQYARVHDRPFTLITGPVEHAAVAATARQLRDTLGASLRVVPVDRTGRVNPDDLRAALRDLPANGIALVSLIHANNEIGTVSPVADYAAIAHEHGALFHTDAVQSPGHLALDMDGMGLDLLSLSSHKFYGPKGAGVLALRERVPYLSAQTGAGHEDGRRAGTHNTPGIVGTAAALEIACAGRAESAARLSTLRQRLIEGVLSAIPDAELTGDPADRLPGHASFAFRDVLSSTLLMHLDQRGIAASSGSACKSGNEQPSAILETLGFGPQWTRGGLRLSLGRSTTAADIAAVLDALPEAVAAVRRIAADVRSSAPA